MKTMKTMKTIKLMSILAMLFVVVLVSCDPGVDTLENEEAISAEESQSRNAQSRVGGNSIDLGTAESFAILSKSGITNVYPSNITGDVGTSPITGAALLLTCGEVTGDIYTVAAAGPLPCNINNPVLLTPTVLAMEAAYTEAAGRPSDVLNLGAGVIGGITLTPGVYKWNSTLVISDDIILDGGADDVWIFQVAGTFNMSSGVRINLDGGAQAKNIFWQVSGAVTLGTRSHFEGTLLGKTSIAVQTGATVNGRLLAQTAVTLQMNTVTLPESDSEPVEPSPSPALEPVDLGTAGNFAILSKSGVTNVPQSLITGNVGTSPIAQTAITGFALTLDSSGEFATSTQVDGRIYAASAAAPTPAMLTTAVLDMQAAYVDAAGRTNPDVLNLGAGVIGGQTLAPGVYKWASTLVIATDITLEGNADDVWIFQVAGTFNMSSAVKINLIGGAQASNIFWQVSGAVTLGTTSHFEGNLLGATSIAVQTGATVNGRLLAQTAVTLQMNTVTIPVPAEVGAACEKANLDLYGPYVQVTTGTLNEEPYVILVREGVGTVQIGYDFNVPGEWEFVIFPDANEYCSLPILPCDNPESCDYAFTISAEDAAILIDEALQLGLNRTSTMNKSSTNGLILLNN
jgi:hypothetical protein